LNDDVSDFNRELLANDNSTERATVAIQSRLLSQESHHREIFVDVDGALQVELATEYYDISTGGFFDSKVGGCARLSRTTTTSGVRSRSAVNENVLAC